MGLCLRVVQSLYNDSNLTISINGRSRKTVQSHIERKQGCPLSLALFGLYIDGLHRFLMSSCLVDVPVLPSGVLMPDLAHADDVTLVASSP